MEGEGGPRPPRLVLRDAHERPVVLHRRRREEELAAHDAHCACAVRALVAIIRALAASGGGEEGLDVVVVAHVDVVDEGGAVVDVGVAVAPHHAGGGDGLEKKEIFAMKSGLL